MKFYRIILFIALSLHLSCVDKEYKWDDINKETLLHIPNIPLGDYEPIKLYNLLEDKLPIGSQYIPSYLWNHVESTSMMFEIGGKYTLRNIFTGDTNKKFFHQYMTNDFIINGSIISTFIEKMNAKVHISFNILDYTNQTIEAVKIKSIEITSDNDVFVVEIPRESYLEMQDAAHLQMTITITSNIIRNISVNEYIQLTQIVMETGGYLSNL